jgi:hypothetical protein
MPATLFPKVLALLATVLLLGIGLTTYTQPNHGGGAYGDLHDMIGRALGDHGPPLPGPPGTLPIEAVDSTLTPVHAGSADSVHTTEPAEWISGAVLRDSAAVREWLGPLVLATATVYGDTVQTTLWRVTLRSGCPLLSRMHATSVGRGTGKTEIVTLSADCPAMTRATPGR